MRFLVNTVQKKGNPVRGKSLGLRNVEIGCVSNKKKKQKNNNAKKLNKQALEP